jgi:murein DD-endopeptidase MepM/ murein hydrolase activator NlpD
MTIDQGSTDSFDPRSWGSGESSIVPPLQPIVTPVVAKRAVTPLMFATAGSFALLVSGVTLAWMMRETLVIAAPEIATTRDAPAPHKEIDTTSKRTLNLASPLALREALIANGLLPAEANAVTAAASKALGEASGEVRAVMTIDSSGGVTRLLRLEASFLDSSGAVVTRNLDNSFAASRVAASLRTKVEVARGEMDGDSFYSSAVAAGVTDSLIPDFAKAFVFDFNFQTEINAGDIFEAAFEQKVNATGQAVGAPSLVYASLTTEAKSRAVYRFTPPGEEAGWFDGNGRSIVRSFMRTPVDGARISSKFGMRFHPILHYNRLHGGTDFAAPQGSPIFASAGGVVTWASMKGCNGNLAIVKHDNGWETFYLHMVNFGPGITVGARVTQGQLLGGVGTTGCSTGPHLHYEVHIDGQKVDPQTIQTEEGRTLSGDVRKAFFAERDRIDVARAGYVG